MPPDLLASLAQFGAAGLIAWLWLSERRTALERDRQLSAAHERLVSERERIEILVNLVAESARALTALEHSQRELARVVERLATVLAAGSPAPTLPARAAG